MFFHYSQNNSGGTFTFDEANGITHHVVIEAIDANKANAKAEEIGIYFDGCDSGTDCSCCGDRWNPVGSNDGDESPMVYGTSVDRAIDGHTWMKEGMEICVHYLNGEKNWYGAAIGQ